MLPAAKTAADAGDTPLEGDYRPAAETPRALLHEHRAEPNIRVEPLQLDFLLRLADALNTTLDLNTLLHRVADLVRAVIDYRIFAILLINDRTHELWMRFQTGHTPDVERMRIKLGRGVAGQAALHRKSILVEDVTLLENYINANSAVRSELAVPLIVKNKVIGVLDLQSEIPAFFTEDHQRLLELTASRVAIAVENARLYTRVSRQAQTLTVLHEISHEITSILDPDDLLERIGALLKRVIDFQMFTILLWNDSTERFEHRFSTRYGERVVRERNVALGEGLIGTAAHDRAPVLAPDVRKDPRYVNENHETRSELSVPLIYKGRVIGVIDLEHTRVNYYNEDHQRTLTTLASPSRSQMLGSTSASTRKNSAWSATSRWRARSSCGCCRPRRRRTLTPRSPPALVLRVPSAATFTTSSTTGPLRTRTWKIRTMKSRNPKRSRSTSRPAGLCWY